MKILSLMIISNILFAHSLYAQRVFKEMKNIEKNEVSEYGYSKGFLKMQNDTLLLCRDLSRIEVYDKEQNLLLEYGKEGKGPGELLFILGMIIYKKQLILLDNTNNKVVYLTFEKEPRLIKEVPIRENGSQFFIVNDTLIVKHSLNDYLLAEYNDNGDIISTYPELNEDDSFNMFGMSGDIFYENNYFHVFKSYNLEVTSFMRKSKNYTTDKLQNEFNTVKKVEIPKIDLSDRTPGIRSYSPPKTKVIYLYNKIDDKLLILNYGLNEKKEIARIVDIYDWSSRNYQYSIKINPELEMGDINLYFPNDLNNYYTRLPDLSIYHVKYTLD